MIFSPCSAEQAQRIKLCPRKSHPQSFPRKVFPQSHSKPPDISSGGLPCASSKTRRAAGHAQPQGSSRGQGPPRMRSIQKALGHFVRGLPLRFIQNPPRSRSRTAAGELEWARPASNEIDTESPRTFRSGGFLRFIQNPPRSRSRTAAGELEGTWPASNEIDTESPRTAVRGLPLRFIQNPPRGRSRTATGELEGARPASNEIHTESPRTFRPRAFCILFFSCCAFSARSPASAAGSGSRRSWR